MELTTQQINDFQEVVWRHYDDAGRDLPWRDAKADGSFDPYKIMVSEIMLQQTQVSRVVPKYIAFLQLFPDVESLAAASLEDVLRAWSGLGYNRRAKFLWSAAQKVVTDCKGSMPQVVTELQALPGLGYNTAAAIATYAYDAAAPFIETNVRTVYIHHFFNDRTDISDKELLPLIEQTLPAEHYRQWYWAIMDYGSHLKATIGNVSRQSKHYVKQASFQGSRRQIRGQIIQLLMKRPHSLDELRQLTTDERLELVLRDLVSEHMIRNQNGQYSL